MNKIIINLKEFFLRNRVIILSILLIEFMIFGFYKSFKLKENEKDLERYLSNSIRSFAYTSTNASGENRKCEVLTSMKIAKEASILYNDRGGTTDNEISLIRAFCDLEAYWRWEETRIDKLLSNQEVGNLLYDISSDVNNRENIEKFIAYITGDVKPNNS